MSQSIIYENSQRIYNLFMSGVDRVFYDCNQNRISRFPIGNEVSFFMPNDIIKNETDKNKAINLIVAFIHKKTDQTVNEQRSLLPRYRSMNVDNFQ